MPTANPRPISAHSTFLNCPLSSNLSPPSPAVYTMVFFFNQKFQGYQEVRSNDENQEKKICINRSKVHTQILESSDMVFKSERPWLPVFVKIRFGWILPKPSSSNNFNNMKDFFISDPKDKVTHRVWQLFLLHHFQLGFSSSKWLSWSKRIAGTPTIHVQVANQKKTKCRRENGVSSG